MSESGYHLPSLVARLRQIVGPDNVRLDEPLSEHTTFKIGGPADIFVTPDDIDEIGDILMACEKTPLEDIVVHLELCLGMRVVEVIRLRRMDIHCSDVPEKCHVSVRGKGRGDGKWRTVPFHPLT